MKLKGQAYEMIIRQRKVIDFFGIACMYFYLCLDSFQRRKKNEKLINTSLERQIQLVQLHTLCNHALGLRALKSWKGDTKAEKNSIHENSFDFNIT